MDSPNLLNSRLNFVIVFNVYLCHVYHFTLLFPVISANGEKKKKKASERKKNPLRIYRNPIYTTASLSPLSRNHRFGRRISDQVCFRSYPSGNNWILNKDNPQGMKSNATSDLYCVLVASKLEVTFSSLTHKNCSSLTQI